MSNIQRICDQCGESGPLEARYCPHCGFDSQGGQAALPAPRKQLPVALSKAALPILAGAASLALRAAWKLVQQRLATTTPAEAAQALSHLARRTPPASPQPAPQPVTRRPRRTIHIRSNWAVGDANGVWRQGSSEHTIEIDE